MNSKQDRNMTTITPEVIASIYRVRRAESHKGDYGRATLVAGSRGMMGAALLAARACMRSGVGLLTVRVPFCGYEIMQLGLPEAKCDMDPCLDVHSYIQLPSDTEVLGVGPGLSQDVRVQEAVGVLLKKRLRLPLVLDADALNILALHPEWLELLPPETILNPHPGEMARLGGDAEMLARKYGLVVVLKGHRTCIYTPHGCFENCLHGNAGMATGGSGDVLTGIILALLAQHYQPTEAAVLGVWLHAHAGDLCLKSQSMESLLPSDIIAHLGEAFKAILDFNS